MLRVRTARPAMRASAVVSLTGARTWVASRGGRPGETGVIAHGPPGTEVDRREPELGRQRQRQDRRRHCHDPVRSAAVLIAVRPRI